MVMLGLRVSEDDSNSSPSTCCSVTSSIRLGADPPLALWETLLFTKSVEASPTRLVEVNGTLDDDDIETPPNNYEGGHHSTEEPTGFFATGIFEDSSSSSDDDANDTVY